jgi:hypothetical protein
MNQIVDAVEKLAEKAAPIAEAGLKELPPPVLATPEGRRGYDRAVDALNRLPRPLVALGTLSLFLMAALDPARFEAWMGSLATVPEPLWWLMGAVLTFFFGARETWHLRQKGKP